VRIRLVLLLAAAPAGVVAQLPRALPEAAGMSAPRLKRIRPVLDSAVARGEVAGVVTLLVRDGKVVALDSSGYADREAKTPMRSNAIFRLASMSKAVTSVAAMILIEEGRLLLSDPVSKYIPSFAKQRVAVLSGPDSAPEIRYEPARRGITVRDLMTHRSGITYGFAAGPIAKMYRDSGVTDGIAVDHLTLAMNADRIAGLPLVHQPGTRFTYGLNTDVLGRIIELVSGQPLDRFFEERIFMPLRMHDTFFNTPDAKAGRIATPYNTDEKGELRLMADQVQHVGERLVMGGKGSRGSGMYFSGGAGLFGTAGDYARFLQMLLNGGELEGARILGPRTVALLTRNQHADLATRPEGSGFSLGFGVVLDAGLNGGYDSEGTFSWGGAYGTSFWVDPKERLIGVMMLQNPNVPRSLAARLHNLAYQAIIR
jgi:CubicO group peptidase (beta-lactamase class C family)